jgi:transcription antitermination protein NusB
LAEHDELELVNPLNDESGFDDAETPPAPGTERLPKPKPSKRKAAPRSAHNQRRRLARELALQTLFEADVTDHSVAEIMARIRALGTTEEQTFAYVAQLVQGISADVDRIDEHIGAAAATFPVAQMPPVDRNVLRIAICELLNHADVPPKVAINEAVDLAKRFGGDKSGRFVNGVLGTVFNRIQAVAGSPESQA